VLYLKQEGDMYLDMTRRAHIRTYLAFAAFFAIAAAVVFLAIR
jgi:hypothetical protein